MLTDDEIARFWGRVAKAGPDECWNWTAGRYNTGYGAQYVSAKRGNMPAHQVAARLTYGWHRTGFVLHSCDNRACCNPAHLRFGSQRENVRDAIERKRHVPPPAPRGNPNPPKGSKVWNQSLTELQVRRIWSMHITGDNQTNISKAVGAPVHVVQDVCRGRSWRHLPDAPSVEALKAGGVRRDKLTPDDIATIKRLLASGMMVKSIARMFGVSTAPISNIKNHGTTWMPKP